MKNFQLTNLTPTKVKQMNNVQLSNLAKEIREFLLSLSQEKEIHLSSNLGIVEISIGLIKKFNFLKNTVIYDTGHQTYIHKILTGRLQELKLLKQKGGPSGLMDMTASCYDHYSPGHSGNSLSVISGLYDAVKFENEQHYYVCVIGDAALNNGLAFEGLSYIGEHQQKIIIIINDNKMSISKAHGILIEHLNKINSQNNVFINFSFQYLQVTDGNNINEVTKAMEQAKKMVLNGPVILHIQTLKGKGLLSAEKDKIGNWHTNNLNNKLTFGQIAANNLNKKLQKNKNLWILNPAMNVGSGFKTIYESGNSRYIDTGICESHTIAMASGLAINHKKVFCLFYSTFLQRSYDQLIHDCARLNLNLTILLDRSDIATNEGNSHHGIFDVGYLKSIPNVTVCSPRDFNQLNQLIDYYYKQNIGINVIRYPIAPYTINEIQNKYKIKRDKLECLIFNKNDTAIITYGPYTNVLYHDILKYHLSVDLYNSIWINNLNKFAIIELLKKYKTIIIYERIYGNNGLFSEINELKNEINCSTKLIPLNFKCFMGHGAMDEINAKTKMDIDVIIKNIK